jgi:hypothetical protein
VFVLTLFSAMIAFPFSGDRRHFDYRGHFAHLLGSNRRASLADQARPFKILKLLRYVLLKGGDARQNLPT